MALHQIKMEMEIGRRWTEVTMTSILPLSLLQPFLLTLVHIRLKLYQQDVCKPQLEKFHLAPEVIAWPKNKCIQLLPLCKYCHQQSVREKRTTKLGFEPGTSP